MPPASPSNTNDIINNLASTKRHAEVVLFPTSISLEATVLCTLYGFASIVILFLFGRALWRADNKALALKQKAATASKEKEKESAAQESSFSPVEATVVSPTSDNSSAQTVQKRGKKNKASDSGMGQGSSSATAAASSASSVAATASSSYAADKMVMLLFVRQDLKMGTGKSAAQCAHAAVASTEQCMDAANYYREKADVSPNDDSPKCRQSQWGHWLEEWRSSRNSSNTIVFKVQTEDELKDIAAKAKAAVLPHYLVRDAGRTQIAAGSRTVTAVGPAPETLVMPMAEGKVKL